MIACALPRPVILVVVFLLLCMTWSGQKVGYVSWRRKEAQWGFIVKEWRTAFASYSCPSINWLMRNSFMWKTEWIAHQRYRTCSCKHTHGNTCARARKHPIALVGSGWSLALCANKQVVDWTFIPADIHTHTHIHKHTHTSGGEVSSHAVWICIKAET